MSNVEMDLHRYNANNVTGKCLIGYVVLSNSKQFISSILDDINSNGIITKIADINNVGYINVNINMSDYISVEQIIRLQKLDNILNI